MDNSVADRIERFPVEFQRRFIGYFLAFATIVPGMLMSGQVLLNLGAFNWARSPTYRIPRWATGRPA